MDILLAWVGKSDLLASEQQNTDVSGPIFNAIKDKRFDQVHILSDYNVRETQLYIEWLLKQSGICAILHKFKLTSPTSYDEIYQAVNAVVPKVLEQSPSANLTFHLSPGTPAMAAIWILLAKTRYRAKLIESSQQSGVKEVNIPFELSAEYLPTPSKDADNALAKLMQGIPPSSPVFKSIIHRCAPMKKVIAMAQRLSLRDVPVLIQGESGTGKELFARAIHQASHRSGAPFVAVNCGAIPLELVDAELFGHEKGAFTGASTARIGYFEAADSGTLFLDEIGELPLASQVRLLRVLQEGEVTRVGSTKPKKIDVRIVAATNRVLPREILEGRFREDLFHRLAVGVLLLPPLREREGDLTLLIDSMLKNINEEAFSHPGYKHKKLDVDARNLLLHHGWPGNVRELHNVLLRASIWALEDRITVQDITESLAISIQPRNETVLGKSLESPISLPDIIADVARHYLERAISQSHGNKTDAAKLLGLGSYQTLSNWLQKYGVS